MSKTFGPGARREEVAHLGSLRRGTLTDDCAREWIGILLRPQHRQRVGTLVTARLQAMSERDALTLEDKRTVARAIAGCHEHLFAKNEDGSFSGEAPLRFEDPKKRKRPERGETRSVVRKVEKPRSEAQ